MFSLLHCVSSESEEVCLVLNSAAETTRAHDAVQKRIVGENWRVLLAGRPRVSRLEKINIKYRISDKRK